MEATGKGGGWTKFEKEGVGNIVVVFIKWGEEERRGRGGGGVRTPLSTMNSR